MRPPTQPAIQKALDVLLKSMHDDDTRQFEFNDPLRIDISTIDRDMKAIETAVQTVVASVNRWVVKVSERRNTLVPFSSLPVELATNIFEHALEADSDWRSRCKGMHSLARVCLQWRHTVLSSSSLWTTVGIASGSAWVQLCLRKSLGAALSIRARGFGTRPDLLKTVISHSYRWRSVKVHLWPSNEDVIQPLKNTLPLLNAIAITSCSVKKSVELSGGPNLRSVSLSGIQPLRWDSGCMSGLYNLHLSDTSNPALPVSTILSVLESCPDLQTLALCSLEEIKELNNTHPSSSRPFPKLYSLQLENLSPEFTSKIIRYIDAPNLHILLVEGMMGESQSSGTTWSALLDATGKGRSTLSIILKQLNPRDDLHIRIEEEKWFDIQYPNVAGGTPPSIARNINNQLSIQLFGQNVSQCFVKSGPEFSSALTSAPIQLTCMGGSPVLSASSLNHFPTLDHLYIKGSEGEVSRFIEVLEDLPDLGRGRCLDPSTLTIHWVVSEGPRLSTTVTAAVQRLNAQSRKMKTAGLPCPTIIAVLPPS